MKRNYPLFTIDRSKHSTYPFDYISCYDRTVGFIAKVVPFFEDAPFNEYLNRANEIEGAEITSVTMRFKKKGGLIIVIEDFLYYFELTKENKNKVQSLLKKALKKYVHAEVEKTAMDNLDIHNQVKQQELTVERAKQNYDQLVEQVHGDKAHADYMIALAEATLETLKNYRDNIGFMNLN